MPTPHAPTATEGALYMEVLAAYLLLLYGLSRWTASRGSNDLYRFAQASGQAPWLMVAFGMVGASLSGVTFLSAPGWVGSAGMTYLQVVLGYLVGYSLILTVLLPLYYRGKYLSIYEFLRHRFGLRTQQTGSAFFLLSRSLGAAARLYLAATVLHVLVFGPLGIPFWVVAVGGPLVIWLYTRKGGLGTVIWTDVLQTTLMLASAGVVGALIYQALPPEWLSAPRLNPAYTRVFEWDASRPDFFGKQFLGGALIALVMTGLDQDMMQKNLSCRSLRAAQWNVGVFSILLLVVNAAFLLLGVLLYQYVDWAQMTAPERSDAVFALVATQAFGPVAAVLFILGLTAAAYSSADGSITALTSSTLVDLMGAHKPEAQPNAQETARLERLRARLHAAYALLFVLLLAGFRLAESLPSEGDGPSPVIHLVLVLAGYTYGPLLGLYAFGLLHKTHQPADRWIPLLAVVSPLLTLTIKLLIDAYAPAYQLGYALLALNGGLTYLGLWLLPRQKD